MSDIFISPRYSEVNPPTGAYVYLHRRSSDGVEFYVGIGEDNDRGWDSGRTQRNKWWRRVAARHGVTIEILQDGLSREDAALLEMWMIAKLRHEGVIICNLTDGGEGLTGWKSPYAIPVNCSNGMRFRSSTEAEKWLRLNGFPKARGNCVLDASVGRMFSAYGFTWWRDGCEPIAYIDRYDRCAKKKGKTVYRSDGVIFQSACMASRLMTEALGKTVWDSAITNAANRNGYAYGYTWSRNPPS